MTTYTAEPLFNTAPARTFASWDAVVDYAHTPAGDPLLIREDGKYQSVISGTYTEWAPNWRCSAVAAAQHAWYAEQRGVDPDTALVAASERLCAALDIADQAEVLSAVRAAYARIYTNV